MSYVDITKALRDWPYEPDKISVRKIIGEDDQAKIQMRAELSIISMEAEGRPDGLKPHGCTSLLEYHRRRFEKLTGKRTASAEPFSLSEVECDQLRNEASLFYRRYIALFVLEEFHNVVRDTTHSLEIFDMCRDYASSEDDREALEEYRPYVLMMQARGRAYSALESREVESALAHIARGIMAIKNHFEGRGQPERFEGAEEVKMLRGLQAELSPQLPETSIIKLRVELRDAIAGDRFEDARKIQNKIDTQLGTSSSSLRR